MMFAVLLLASLTHAGELKPVAQAASFTLSLPVPKERAVQFEKHLRNGRIVLYFPETRGVRTRLSLPRGPVQSMRTYPVRHGWIMTLWPRGSSQDVFSTLRVVTDPAVELHLGQPPAITKPVPRAGETPPALAAAWSTPLETAAWHTAEPPRPVAEWPWGRPDDASIVSQQPILTGALCLLLAALSLTLVWLRGRRSKLPPHEGITVLAMRTLGGRHRLVLVEAGGERMLLATSDKEVTLLSHLEAGAATLAATMGEMPASAIEPPQLQDETLYASPMAVGSTDVQGLLRLRRNAPKLEVVR